MRLLAVEHRRLEGGRCGSCGGLVPLAGCVTAQAVGELRTLLGEWEEAVVEPEVVAASGLGDDWIVQPGLSGELSLELSWGEWQSAPEALRELAVEAEERGLVPGWVALARGLADAVEERQRQVGWRGRGLPAVAEESGEEQR